MLGNSKVTVHDARTDATYEINPEDIPSKLIHIGSDGAETGIRHISEQGEIIDESKDKNSEVGNAENDSAVRQSIENPMYTVEFDTDIGTLITRYHSVMAVKSPIPLLLLVSDVRYTGDAFIPAQNLKSELKVTVRSGENSQEYFVMSHGVNFVDAATHRRYIILYDCTDKIENEGRR